MTRKLGMARTRAALERKVAQVYRPMQPHQQIGLIHHNVDCIDCRACEIAYQDKNGLPPGPRFRRAMYIEGGRFPEVYAYKVNMSCNHCAKPTCPTGAIWKRKRTAWSISTRPCPSVAAAAKRPVPTAHRSGIRWTKSSRSAGCASMNSMPAASLIA